MTISDFRQEYECPGGVAHLIGITGKEHDSESGLDNFAASYNASNLGRFMSPDPIFVHVLRVIDPQRLNLYAYARNNPLAFLDPTGQDIISGTGDQKAVKAALVEIAKWRKCRAIQRGHRSPIEHFGLYESFQLLPGLVGSALSHSEREQRTHRNHLQ